MDKIDSDITSSEELLGDEVQNFLTDQEPLFIDIQTLLKGTESNF